MWIKTAMRYKYTSTNIAKFKRLMRLIVNKNVKQQELSYMPNNTLEKMWPYLLKLKFV